VGVGVEINTILILSLLLLKLPLFCFFFPELVQGGNNPQGNEKLHMKTLHGGFGGAVSVPSHPASPLQVNHTCYQELEPFPSLLSTLCRRLTHSSRGPGWGITCNSWQSARKTNEPGVHADFSQILRLSFRENHFQLGWGHIQGWSGAFKLSWAANLRYIFGEGTTCSINKFWSWVQFTEFSCCLLK
jgi:hypothetical protein